MKDRSRDCGVREEKQSTSLPEKKLSVQESRSA
jgi:hypothetical protein